MWYQFERKPKKAKKATRDEDDEDSESEEEPLEDDDDDTTPAAWVVPDTLAEYEQCPSTKLDATIQIIKHHLGTPGAAPLRNLCPGGDSLVPSTPEWDAYTNELVPTPDALSAPPPQPRRSPSRQPTENPAAEDVPPESGEATKAGPSTAEPDTDRMDVDDVASKHPPPSGTPFTHGPPFWDTSMPDKIVVYSFFIPQLQLLRQVSSCILDLSYAPSTLSRF